MKINATRKEYIAYFLTGCLLGILCFVAIYGIKILDVRYDIWLLLGDFDLAQHYVGWGHFRNDAWQFPIGLVSTLSYPYSMSVVYTDSIPIVAVFFKLLSPILPATFQYFGLYGLVSFMLMGGLSMLLIHRFVESRVITVLASIFFITSFPILHRMYYHTALASQWLIILALVIWFYSDINEPSYKKCIKWGFMGFLCVGIHSYFLPMVGGIMAVAIIDECISSYKITGKVKHKIIEGIYEITSFCVFGLFNLWLLGGLYGGASAIGGGLGDFEGNLNTFINPLGHGINGASLAVYNDFQYEGFGYLGLGMLLLLAVMIVGVVGLLILNGSAIQPKAYIKEHHRQTLMVLLFILFVVLATGPMYTIGDHRILTVPLPRIVKKVAGIFRSNGRFIWVSMYILMLAIVVTIDRIMRKSMKIVIFCLALIIQIVDLSPEIVSKQLYFNRRQTFNSMWEATPLQQILTDKEEFIVMDSSSWVMMDTAYYAFKHDMKTNVFYFARDIDDKINAQRAEYEQELLEGNAREDAVYVFLKEGFEAAKYPDLVIYETGEYIVGVKRK